LLLVAAVAVRAGEDDDEAPKAKAKAKAPAKAHHAAGRAGPGQLAASHTNSQISLPRVTPDPPVQPFAYDAAALGVDDREFDNFRNSYASKVGKDPRVESLVAALSKSEKLLAKMTRDLDAETLWTKNVYDIIQNYEYKYLKTLKDIKVRGKKIQQLAKLVDSLKAPCSVPLLNAICARPRTLSKNSNEDPPKQALRLTTLWRIVWPVWIVL